MRGGDALLIVWVALPGFAEIYWIRLVGLRRVLLGPDGERLLSGRAESWRTLFAWIADNPWRTVFGIGYKTLPYTTYLGDPIVADNMYLSLLIETGVAGLAAVLWLNGAILRAAVRAARAAEGLRGFLGAWMFCFWCGRVRADALGRPAHVLARAAGLLFRSGACRPRMNILLLDQFSEPGGAQLNLLDTLGAIRRRGWKALVGLPGNGEMFERVRALGFEVERIRLGPYESGRKSAGDMVKFALDTAPLARQIRRMARALNADLVYINGPRALPAAALARLGIPALFHTHSYLPEGPVRKLARWSLVRMNAAVVGCCEFVASPWERTVGAARLSVIYNGVAGPASFRTPGARRGSARRVHRQNRAGEGTTRVCARRRCGACAATGCAVRPLRSAAVLGRRLRA